MRRKLFSFRSLGHRFVAHVPEVEPTHMSILEALSCHHCHVCRWGGGDKNMNRIMKLVDVLENHRGFERKDCEEYDYDTLYIGMTFSETKNIQIKGIKYLVICCCTERPLYEVYRITYEFWSFLPLDLWKMLCPNSRGPSQKPTKETKFHM